MCCYDTNSVVSGSTCGEKKVGIVATINYQDLLKWMLPTRAHPPVSINGVACFLRATQVTFHYLRTSNIKLSINIRGTGSPGFQINNLNEKRTTQVYIYIHTYIYIYIIFAMRKARNFNILSLDIIINTPGTLALYWSDFLLTQITKSTFLSLQEGPLENRKINPI